VLRLRLLQMLLLHLRSPVQRLQPVLLRQPVLHGLLPDDGLRPALHAVMLLVRPAGLLQQRLL
jgi:hypothetical protein